MDINEILEKLPPAPADVEKWIRRAVVKETYIIYNKKENRAVCTRCGHTFRADRFNMAHGTKGTCPRCKSEAVYKASGKGRINCTEYFRVMIFTHRGKDVYGTLWEIRADFTEIGPPQLSKWLSAVYLFSEKEQIYYKHHPGWAYGQEDWKRHKKIKLPQPPAGLYGNSYFRSTALYEKNLENVFLKSCLKYFWDESFLQKADFNAYGYVEYISLSLKHQSMELLRKAGFDELVREKVCDAYGVKRGIVNWRGKTLSKILGLPKRHIRRLRKANPGHRELDIFKQLTEKEKQMPDAFMRRITHYSRYIDDIREYTTLIKWYEYTQKRDVRAYDWIDYITACRKLGMDISRNKILFPENFQQAHDDVTQRVETEVGKKIDSQIRNATFDIEIEWGGLVLLMARTQTELNAESAALNHCVRSYGDKIIRGASYIFFIRKADAREIPYYTMETGINGGLIQCRGECNCSMTDDVKVFVERVLEDLRKILQQYQKRSAA